MKHALKTAEGTNSHDWIIASFLFHGRGAPLRKNPLGLFRSLIHQLLQRVPTFLSSFSALFQKKCATQGKFGEKWYWQEPELRSLLQEHILTASRTCEIKLYIDALDECGEDVATILVEYFQRLTHRSHSMQGSLSICFSCRHYPIAALEDGYEICVEDENDHGINTYINEKITSRSCIKSVTLQELQNVKRADIHDPSSFDRHSFLAYAVTWWEHHVRIVEEEQLIQEDLLFSFHVSPCDLLLLGSICIHCLKGLVAKTFQEKRAQMDTILSPLRCDTD